MMRNKIPHNKPRLIETNSFPIEFLSALADRESWRKEVHRPIYHIHKWWAIRLGSIFRGIVLGCLLSEGDDFQEAYYHQHNFSNIRVFDPFMGSGTTIGEAHKLGCITLGRDINPVACESVRVALGPLNAEKMRTAFSKLSDTIGRRIQDLYRSDNESDGEYVVLYYFWVKVVPCPYCNNNVDLFPSYIFSRNAYPERKPEVQIYCPKCSHVFKGLNHINEAICPNCSYLFKPNTAPANRDKATCTFCLQSFPIITAVRKLNHPPKHRMFAKLLLTPEGEKKYVATTVDDIGVYERCSAILEHELNTGKIRLPNGALSDGYNTRQAMGYNYRNWRDFFNDRQLLALGWLQEEISKLEDVTSRDALFTLFSGVLEFNNMFASYKGEGTGAVRHMFSHHILKPEKVPIEANVWGTTKSSGSFSSLFKSRMLRAIEYRNSPFEVSLTGSGKANLYNSPMIGETSLSWPIAGDFVPKKIYLSCGSSDETELPDKSIDLVITDPPFFDNVHYSELADFFYSWQSLYPRGFVHNGLTTRHLREVQDSNALKFADKLAAVFKECNRILVDDGLLVFSYHHSRPEGWTALVHAIYSAGFTVVSAHPVKAEMSVATPKSQAKEPIQLDIIIVCKKSEIDKRKLAPTERLKISIKHSSDKISRLINAGFNLSMNDRRIILVSQFIAQIGPYVSATDAIKTLTDNFDNLEEAAEKFSIAEDI